MPISSTEFCPRCGGTSYQTVVGSPEKYCEYCDWIFGQVCPRPMLKGTKRFGLQIGASFTDTVTGRFYVWNGSKWAATLTGKEKETAKKEKEEARIQAIKRKEQEDEKEKKRKKAAAEKERKLKEAAAEKEMSEWELRMKRVLTEDSAESD